MLTIRPWLDSTSGRKVARGVERRNRRSFVGCHESRIARRIGDEDRREMVALGRVHGRAIVAATLPAARSLSSEDARHMLSAYSSRPISMRRISLVPAPIS